MRDVLIIATMCVAALAIGAWLYFYGPTEFRNVPPPQGEQHAANASSDSNDAVDVPFSVIESGNNAANVSTRKNYAARDTDAFAKLWTLTYGKNAPPLPSIDFDTEYVIGVFAGEQSTGGYAIAVSSVTDHGTASRTVSVTVTKPGTDCVNTQALTSPYQIIRVPVSIASLTREDRTVEKSCN